MPFIYLLQDLPSFFISLLIILGLMVGSFLNVVIYRLPEMMKRNWLQQCAELRGEIIRPQPPFNLITPRSRCIYCGHQITILENIPIISYLFLQGRCSQCQMAISISYPAIEIITACMSGFVAWHFGVNFITLAALIFVWALIALAAIDLRAKLLPDDITQPLLWLGLLVNINSTFSNIYYSIIGAMVGYLSLWLIYWSFKLTTRKEGMGYGDFKLLSAVGAWLGWNMLPLVILSASLIGTGVSIGLITAAKIKKNASISFGPYLASGAFIALIWGEKVNRAYLDYFNL